jgi:hypothetical protein
MYARSGLLAYERSLQGVDEALPAAGSPARVPSKTPALPDDPQPIKRPASRAAARPAKRTKLEQAPVLPAQQQEAQELVHDGSLQEAQLESSLAAGVATTDGNSSAAQAGEANSHGNVKSSNVTGSCEAKCLPRIPKACKPKCDQEEAPAAKLAGSTAARAPASSPSSVVAARGGQPAQPSQNKQATPEVGWLPCLFHSRLLSHFH